MLKIEDYYKKNREILEMARRIHEEGIKKILIVDDDQNFLTSIRCLMEETGFDNIEVSRNSKEATISIEENGYDLILIDIDLGHDEEPFIGLKIIKETISFKKDSTVVAITAKEFNSFNEEGKEILDKIDGFLVKPIDPEDLFKVILGIKYSNIPIKGINENYKPEHNVEWATNSVLQMGSGISDELDELLLRLIAETGSMALVAEANNETKEIIYVVSNGISKEKFENIQLDLWKSPIKDVVIDNIQFLENKVKEKREHFRYLLSIIDGGFGSFIGIPIEVLGDVRYGLFLFHIDEEEFSMNDVDIVKKYSQMISIALSKKAINLIFEKEQRSFLAGRFNTALAHNLRHLMGSISNETYLLNLKGAKALENPDDKKFSDFYSEFCIIQNRLQRYYGTIRKSIEFFLETKEDERPVLDNINKRIESICWLLNPIFKHAKVDMQSVLDSRIKPFYLYYRIFEHVLLNVLFNAFEQIQLERERLVDYKSERGSILVETKIISRGEIRSIQIKVKDNGPGIHKAYLEKIFDSSFSTRKKGAGYGLYLSRQLMKRLKGEIKVEQSMIFLGSTFLIEIGNIDRRKDEGI